MRLISGLLTAGLTQPSPAELQLTAKGALFYTNDVGLFSATRRLSLNDDPTQPALDSRLTGQGSDGVFEPQLTLGDHWLNPLGKTRFDLEANGFVYVVHGDYDHATLRSSLRHEWSTETALNLSYYYSPDLYLGENSVRHPAPLVVGGEVPGEWLAPEVLTSHIFSLRFDQALSEDVELRLLGRYGKRNYDKLFSERDLDLWTLGSHLAWRPLDELSLTVGYHFEQGMATGRLQPWLNDDVSYDNHYLSFEIEYQPVPKYQLLAAVHYERNYWLTHHQEDERLGKYETVTQGELMMRHELTEMIRLHAGVQYSIRTENNVRESIDNLNVSVGVSSIF